MEQDLQLRELKQHYCTSMYHKIPLFRTAVTDGVKYVMDNGYSWFVTDSMAVIETAEALQGEGFMVIDLELKESNSAFMRITDGNENILYEQRYSFTNAEQNVRLYWQNGIMLLPTEY